jgi:hypothetical protein
MWRSIRFFRNESIVVAGVAATFFCQLSACRPEGGSGTSGNVRRENAVQCTPNCGNGCGDDGCGGTCTCPSGAVCSAAFQCVPSCTDQCQSAGWTCGSLCGTSCGTCGSGQSCIWSNCYQSSHGQSCPDCSLRLTLLSTSTDSTTRGISQATIAVDYSPSDAEPHPRLADLRIRANTAVTLTSAIEGPALTDVSKQLFVDPATGQHWRVRTDGTNQLLVISFANTNRLNAGRVATLTFSVLHPETTVSSFLAFKLIKRNQTFAPPDADAALQSSQYDLAVVASHG